MVAKLLGFAAGVLALSSGLVNAHGSHAGNPDPADDWATRHMIEEHHIGSFDPLSFFTLHDYDSSGAWTTDEVRKTYGMDDESNDHISEARKQEALDKVFKLFDPDNTGVIWREDFEDVIAEGIRLPDLGFGAGHHGDDEYEYEIHHFEKYHGDDATEEELTHPEDIAHFRKHDEEEALLRRIEQLEQIQIVDQNIPLKFRRNF